MQNIEKISRSRVLNSLGWKILERICSQGVNLIVQILLARLIAPSDFGSLAIIITIINYAGVFVQSGLSVSIIQKEDLDIADVNTIFTSSMFIALLMYIGLFFASPWISNIYNLSNLVWPLRVLALILFFNSINSVQTAMLSRNMLFKQIFLRSIIAVPLSGFIGVLLAYKGFGLWALVIYTLVSMGLTVLVMALASPYRFHFEFSWTRAKVIYSFSVKILLSSLISGFGDSLRVLVIGKKYNTSDLAYYEKAYSYSAYFTQIITSSFGSVLLPTFSRSQQNIGELLRMARRTVQLTSFCVIPFLTLIICLAEPLISLFLTNIWLPSVPFLCIFCILRIPACIMVIDKHVYYSIGNSQIGMYYELCLLIVNLLMLLYTVPISVKAIAMGYLIVEMFGCFSIFIISSKIYGYSLRLRFKDLIRPVVNSTIMYFVLSYNIPNFDSNLLTIILKGIVGLIIYVLLSIVTKDKNISYIINLIPIKKFLH